MNIDFDKEIEELKNSLIAGIVEITDELKRTISDPNCDVETVRTAPLRIRKGSADFKGEKPVSITLPDGRNVEVKTWKQTAEVLLRDCFKAPDDQEWLRSQCGRVAGRLRVLLTDDRTLLQRPVEICDNVFFETKQDVPIMFDIMIDRFFRPMDYDYQNVIVNVKFDAPVLYQEMVQETDEEDVSEDMSEDDDIQMGGMNL